MVRKDEFIKERNQKLSKKVIEALKKRHFDAYFCENKQQALEKAMEFIKKEYTISWGGSMTLGEVGIIDYLENNAYKTINRDKAKTPEEKTQCAYDAFKSDVFLMSANAISQDGQLINIDGLGNRVAALIFGPKKVIVIAGMNKVAKDFETACNRARNFAAPCNMQRIAAASNRQTPCAVTGDCADCYSPDSICCQMVTTRLCRPEGRIVVILVNEELGY